MQRHPQREDPRELVGTEWSFSKTYPIFIRCPIPSFHVFSPLSSCKHLISLFLSLGENPLFFSLSCTHIHTPLFYSLLHPTAQLRPVHRSPFAVASLLFTFSLRYKPMFMLCFHLLCSAFLRVLMIAMIFFPVFSVFCLMGLFIFSFRLVGALQNFSFSGFTCLDLVSVESVGGCCCGWVWV